MPTYALLGATGATGSAILRCLLEQPPKDLALNILVRNKAKLDKAFPLLQTTEAFAIDVTEGTPSDGAALQRSLKGASVVFMCIATNVSTRGVSLSYDTTRAIIDALEALREEQGTSYIKPTILQLRTASLNEVFIAHHSWQQRFGCTAASFCLHYVYSDLDRAAKLLQSSAASMPECLDYVFVDPPALHDADGTTRTGYELVMKGEGTDGVSYADLGAAFCEIAEKREKFLGQGVGVSATGKVNETWGVLIGYLSGGVKARFFG
ncbi:hypothetical protein LTR36_005776 [Oleoguttula mirabilis]|uniref:NAD(P)-binding domain-containing protein n=1 Tax=Oleoguttula mirabilis TaxID=1507867 RepID=A0AAV9JDL3_9PEZI|nr:hypothetical protein LTR36_005776 [Oleoguttula mirabilis]